MVKSWQEKEIIFPEELIFTKYGKDTVKYNIPVSDDFVATVVKRLFFFSAVTQLIKILCKHRAYLSR